VSLQIWNIATGYQVDPGAFLYMHHLSLVRVKGTTFKPFFSSKTKAFVEQQTP